MRIVYIVNHSVLYGANLSLLNLLIELKKKNVDILVVLAYQGGLCDALKRENIPYIVVRHYLSILPVTKSIKDYILFIPRYIYQRIVNLYAILFLYFKLKNKKIDFIHTNVGPDYIGYCLSRMLSIKHIWHIREYQKEDFNMKPIWGFKVFLKILHKSLVISITDSLFKNFNLNKNLNSSTVIYNGIRNKIKLKYTDKKDNYFLFVGRLEDNKGIFNLLSAFSKIKNKSIELLVLGTGKEDYVKKLKYFVENNDLGKRVKFLGFCNDVDSLMFNAKALIVPSKNEGFGRITAEAMFNGCLVIGYKSAGTQEILEKNKLGLLYSSEEELINYMDEVADSDIDKYKPMILKALKEAEEKYTVEINAEHIYNFYNNNLEKSQ